MCRVQVLSTGVSLTSRVPLTCVQALQVTYGIIKTRLCEQPVVDKLFRIFALLNLQAVSDFD